MASSFSMHPSLSFELIKKIGYSGNRFEFSYTDDNEDFPIGLDDINGTESSFVACLRDPRCIWYPETSNLIIRKKCTISNPAILFGSSGIAPRDAVIGVAIIWISSKSDQRGVVACGCFDAESSKVEISAECRFDKSCIKGSIQLQLILYLKESGNPTYEERHLNNATGVTYGTIEQCEIFTDGNGSVFPISTVYKESKPLWWVYYDESADPMIDSFDDENVGIVLNKAHPLFETLKVDSSLKESPLLLEVLSSAMVIIMNSIRDSLGTEWKSIIASQDFSHGSLAEAMYHFVYKLQWNFDTQAELSKSIHSYFDKIL